MQPLIRSRRLPLWLCWFAMGCGTGQYAEDRDPSQFGEAALGGAADYEAESATSKSGCLVATNHAGYTGSGFIDFGGNGTWIEWNDINAAAAGDYTLTFRYAVAAGSRQSALLINGTSVGSIPFGATGAWTTWETVSVTKALKTGRNTIRVLANTGSGGPNLDKVTVVSNGGGRPKGAQRRIVQTHKRWKRECSFRSIACACNTLLLRAIRSSSSTITKIFSASRECRRPQEAPA